MTQAFALQLMHDAQRAIGLLSGVKGFTHLDGDDGILLAALAQVFARVGAVAAAAHARGLAGFGEVPSCCLHAQGFGSVRSDGGFLADNGQGFFKNVTLAAGSLEFTAQIGEFDRHRYAAGCGCANRGANLPVAQVPVGKAQRASELPGLASRVEQGHGLALELLVIVASLCYVVARLVCFYRFHVGLGCYPTFDVRMNEDSSKGPEG